MKLNIWATALTLLVTATSISAESANKNDAATLQTERGVEVLFVNSQNADDLDSPFTLSEGSNQLVIRVNKAIGRGDKRTQIKSAPYILNVDVDSGALYIDAPSIKDARKAEQLFSDEKLDWNVTLNDQAIDYSQYKMPGDKGAFPYANLEQQLAKYNLANGVQVVTTNPEKLTEMAKTVSPELKQAQNAYLQMSDSDRIAFLKWLSEQ